MRNQSQILIQIIPHSLHISTLPPVVQDDMTRGINGNPLQYLAWRIPWMGEPGGLLSMGSHRVRHNWSNFACLHALEKEMATHSSPLAWRIPETEEQAAIYGIMQSWTRLKQLSSGSNIKAWNVFVHFLLLSRVQLCDPMVCSPPGSSVHGILPFPSAKRVRYVYSFTLLFSC